MNDLERIERFIAKHHVLSLATVRGNIPFVCSVFYAYDPRLKSFVFASEEKTAHIQNALANPHLAANIHLETKEVGQVQGLQIKGLFQHSNEEQKKLYFKRFPYARAFSPALYALRTTSFKYTDNRLGFGRKIILDFET